MGTRVKKERRKLVSTGVSYEVAEDGIYVTTDCPFGKKTESGIQIKVGSGSCLECEHFISDNMKISVVECNCKKKLTVN